MLVPEPENEYDANAIAVKRLDGKTLGYVPRDCNESPVFRGGGVLFAHVKSQGPTAGTPHTLGAMVSHISFQSQIPLFSSLVKSIADSFICLEACWLKISNTGVLLYAARE